MTITSRELILKSAEEYVVEKGAADLNIRTLASYSKCSVGTIYYHFASKNDLMLGLHEFFWTKNFRIDIENANFEGSFIEFIDFYYSKEIARENYYKDFLLPGILKLSNEEIEKYLNIETVLRHRVTGKFVEMLNKDRQWQNYCWNEELSKENFCQFVIESIESAILFNSNSFSILKVIINNMLK